MPYPVAACRSHAPAGSGAAAPTNTVAPAITGTATEGQTLTASTGTWTGSPSSYAYQWKRGGVSIGGATSSTYLLVTADVGSTITVTVTATNAGGSAAATSAATATVAAIFTPLALAPELWVESDDLVYSDAARTTLQTTNAGTVRGMTDRSGSGNHLAKSGGTPPTLETNSQNSKNGVRWNGSQDGLISPSFLGTVSAITFAFVGKDNSGGFSYWGGTTNNRFLGKGSSLLGDAFGEIAIQQNVTQIGVFVGDATYQTILMLSASGNAWLTNGTASVIAAITGSLTYGNQDGGSAGSFSFNGRHYAALVKKARVTGADLSNLLDYWRTKWNPFTAFPTSVYCGGDSITAGVGETPWPVQMKTSLGASYAVMTAAKPGDGMTAIAASAVQRIDPFLCAVFPKRICILHGGTNSLASGTGDAHLSAYWAYLAARKAAGATHVVATTLLPFAGSTGGIGVGVNNGTTEQKRQYVNNLVKTTWAANGADAFIDLETTETRLRDASNTTYFADGTHLTTAGAGVFASCATPVIAGL